MPRTAAFEIRKPAPLDISEYRLALSERGKNCADSLAVLDATTRTCGYLARRNGEGRWSVHTDAGHYLGTVPTVEDALYLLASYYAEYPHDHE